MKRKSISVFLVLTVLIYSLSPLILAVDQDDTLEDLQGNAAAKQGEANRLANQLANYEKELASVQNNIATTKEQISETKSRIAETEALVLEMLPFMQKNMHVNFTIEFLFSENSNDSFLTKLHASSTLTNSATKEIKKLNELAQELAAAEKQLAADQQKLEKIVAEVKAEEAKAQKAAKVAYQEAQVVEQDFINLGCDSSMTVSECFGGRVAPSGSFVLPLAPGYISCGFTCYPNHGGIDFGGRYLNSGTPASLGIYPSASGMVVKTHKSCAAGSGYLGNQCGGMYGNHVYIVSEVGGSYYTTVYAHLDAVYVNTGQIVTIYDQIGIMGNTGNSSGRHLHYEVRTGAYPSSGQYSNRINPGIVQYIPGTDVDFYHRW